MRNPPRDRLEFWVRFVCAFFVFGLVVALLIIRIFQNLEIMTATALWVAIVLPSCIYAARVGDPAWHKLIKAMPWVRWWK